MPSVYEIGVNDFSVATSPEDRLDEQRRKQIQHELKIYLEKYFKEKLGKGPNLTKIIISHDMLIIRGERFLTEPEKFILTTNKGNKAIKRSRMHVARQHSIDNMPHIEKTLGARAVHEGFTVDANKDFWMHAIVFDRVLAN